MSQATPPSSKDRLYALVLEMALLIERATEEVQPRPYRIALLLCGSLLRLTVAIARATIGRVDVLPGSQARSLLRDISSQMSLRNHHDRQLRRVEGASEGEADDNGTP